MSEKNKKTDSSNKTKSAGELGFALSLENYFHLAIAFVIIIIGFLLMMGGKVEDPSEFNPEIFNFRRITLAPIIVMIGFVYVIYAIMKKPKA